MTSFTVGGEIGGLVIRIIGLIVIIQMAARACIWCVIVITIVTGGALIRDGRMRSYQRIIIVVYRKLRRIPSRSCGMALNAVCRQS